MLSNYLTHRVIFSLNVTRCYGVAKEAATAAIGFSVRTVRAYIRACDIFWNVTLPSITLVKPHDIQKCHPFNWPIRIQETNMRYNNSCYHILHLHFKGSCVSQGEQYRIRQNWNLYIFLQRKALIDIKISIINICFTNMTPTPKTLMFSLLHERKIQWKCESRKIYQHAGDSCPPNRYRPFTKTEVGHAILLTITIW